MNVYFLLMYFGLAAVLLAWSYAYYKLRVRAFAVLGVAFLIFLVGRQITTLLLTYTEIDPFLLVRVYGAVTNIVTGVLFASLSLYGIIKLVRLYEAVENGEEVLD
ncbi:MAG: hypothetical protein R6U44_10035 [Archaeoglobaceae archaeon]